MKVKLSKKGYTLSGVSAEQLDTVMYLLGNIKERCFTDAPEENGDYYSGSDFLAVLNKQQLKNFHEFIDGFWENFNTKHQ